MKKINIMVFLLCAQIFMSCTSQRDRYIEKISPKSNEIDYLVDWLKDIDFNFAKIENRYLNVKMREVQTWAITDPTGYTINVKNVVIPDNILELDILQEISYIRKEYNMFYFIFFNSRIHEEGLLYTDSNEVNMAGMREIFRINKHLYHFDMLYEYMWIYKNSSQ